MPAASRSSTRRASTCRGDPPTKELPLHFAFYEARPRPARWCICIRPMRPRCPALPTSIREDAIPPITPYVVMRVGRVPVVPYTRPGSADVAPLIRAKARRRMPAVLLANHGPVVAGTLARGRGLRRRGAGGSGEARHHHARDDGPASRRRPRSPTSNATFKLEVMMPRFSANLGFLWPDRPLLERIDAAARAGFKAIELHWPYDVPAAEVKAACAGNGLRLLGLNTVARRCGRGRMRARRRARPRGRVPGAASIRRSPIAVPPAATAIHAMAGVVPPAERGGRRRSLRRATSSAAAARRRRTG